MLLDAAKETGDWRGLARRVSRSMARHRGGAGGGGEEKLARQRLGGVGLEEAEVNERGARLPRRETRPAAAALERGTLAPLAGEERWADHRHGEDADPAGAAPGMRR